MTDEEKKAIEFWQGQVELYSKEGRPRKTLQILLNLIEKQDKIIENQKYIIQERDTEISDLKDSRCLVKRYFKLKDENKIKDKIIENMAEWIFDKDYTKNSLLIHRDDYYSNCIKQVIGYFEKKEG